MRNTVCWEMKVVWSSDFFEYIVILGLAGITIYLLKTFFDTFFIPKEKRVYQMISYIVFGMWQIIIFYFHCFLASQRLFITSMLTIMVSVVSYQGTIWKKCIFSLLYFVLATRFFESTDSRSNEFENFIGNYDSWNKMGVS